MKKCLQCGKEGEGDFCQYCGAPLSQEEMEIPETESVNEVKNTEDVKSVQEEPVVDDVQEVNVTGENMQYSTSSKKPAHKKKMIGIIIAVAVIVIAGIGFAVKNHMDNEKRKEYVETYNQYLDDIDSLKFEMLQGAADAEGVCNLTLSVWSNAIWEKADSKTDKYTRPNGVFVDDFNDALSNLTSDETVMQQRADLSLQVDNVSEKMEKMKNPPEGLEDKYETLKEMFDVYSDFLDVAVHPSGSYTSYNSDINSYDTSFMKLYRKVDALDLTHITE